MLSFPHGKKEAYIKLITPPRSVSPNFNPNAGLNAIKNAEY